MRCFGSSRPAAGVSGLHFGATSAKMAPCRVCRSKMYRTTLTGSCASAPHAHQSLQEYLLSRLIADASQPTLEEVFERAAQRDGGVVSFGSAVSHLRAERDRR
jgi:antitoxin FitA